MGAANRRSGLAILGRGIQSVKAPGALQQGTAFSWTTDGLAIHSQVQRLIPERSLGWTGTAWTAKAIHQWTLQPEAPDRTRVIVEESMEGLWIAKFYTAQKLSEAITLRVLALKRAAEHSQSPASDLSNSAPSAKH